MILAPLIDGGIVNYKDDSRYITGCETCDYGSSYINDITVALTKHVIHIVLDEMYTYFISESDMMKLMLSPEIPGMTEEQFADWLKDRLTSLIEDRYTYRENVLREYEVRKI